MKPLADGTGFCSRSTLTTSGYENHEGISLPVLRRCLSSVPEMLAVRVPSGISSRGMYSSRSGR